VAAYPAVADGIPHTRIEPKEGLPLQFLRASGLAQARLQLAVLSGNRRRALEQIDRLVQIDKEIERIADGTVGIARPLAQLASELVDQRLAIASEKLALASEVKLPRLEPAFPEEIEVVEADVPPSRFAWVLLLASGVLVLSLGIAAAAVLQV